jgi:hypothetical protein
MAHFIESEGFELSERPDNVRIDPVDEETGFTEHEQEATWETGNQTPTWAQGSDMPIGLDKGDVADPKATQRLVKVWARAFNSEGPRAALEFRSSKRGDLWVKWGSKWELLTYRNNPSKYLVASTIQKYGVDLAWALGIIPDALEPISARLRTLNEESTAKLQAFGNEMNSLENTVPKEVMETATRATQALDTLLSEVGTQTLPGDFPLRELKALDKSLQRIRGELVNTQAKISAIDGEIARREQKVKDSPNEAARKIQEEKIRELRGQRELYEGILSTLQGNLKNQFTQIRELIYKVLNDDTTLGERIRTIFREQGITIASVLTALGFIISTLALALTGGGGAATPPPPPANKGGLRGWAKQRLQDLGRLLGKLAEKAGAALPGIIGSIVSWLLSTAQKAVGWLAENLWALVVAITGMVYLTVKDYMVRRSNHE